MEADDDLLLALADLDEGEGQRGEEADATASIPLPSGTAPAVAEEDMLALLADLDYEVDEQDREGPPAAAVQGPRSSSPTPAPAPAPAATTGVNKFKEAFGSLLPSTAPAPAAQPARPPPQSSAWAQRQEAQGEGYKEPCSGISIRKPILSSVVLRERLRSLQYYSLEGVSRKAKAFEAATAGARERQEGGGGAGASEGINGSTWCTVFAIGKRFAPDASGRSPCLRWAVTDLADGSLDAPVAVFLYDEALSAYKHEDGGALFLAKGARVRADDPSKASKGRRGLGFSLTVSRAGQLIKLGSALDLATCRASRKGGGACESLVNKQKCEYCIYHLGNAERDYTSLRAGLKNSGSNHLVNAVTKRSQDARSRTAQLREERSIAAAGPPGPKPLAEVKKAAGLQATGATGGQVAGAVKSGVGRRYISAVVTEVEKRGGQVPEKMDGILVSLGPGAGRDDGQDEAKPSAPPSRRKSEYPEPESDEDLLIEEDDAPPAKAPPPPAPLTGAAHNPEVEAARVLLRKGLRALLAVEGADDRQLGELRRHVDRVVSAVDQACTARKARPSHASVLREAYDQRAPESIALPSGLSVPAPDPNKRKAVPERARLELEQMNRALAARQAEGAGAEGAEDPFYAEAPVGEKRGAVAFPTFPGGGASGSKKARGGGPSVGARLPGTAPRSLAEARASHTEPRVASGVTVGGALPPTAPVPPRKAAPKPKSEFARVFGSLTESKENRVEGAKAAAKYAGLARQDRLDEFDEAFKAASARLDKEEQLEDKLVGTQSVPVRAWFCLTCKVYTFGKGKKCEEDGHAFESRQTTKFFLKCFHCSERTQALGKKTVDRPCAKCCHPSKHFVPCGVRDASRNKEHVLEHVAMAKGHVGVQEEIRSLRMA